MDFTTFISSVYIFCVEWMYVLHSATFVLLAAYCVTFNKKHPKVSDITSNFAAVLLVTMLGLAIFSNRVSFFEKEVAIYKKNGRLVLQEKPGIYFGLYFATYFEDKETPECEKVATEADPPFVSPKPKKYICDYYVVNWERFVSEANNLDLFALKNMDGSAQNTRILVRMALSHYKSSLPPYLTKTRTQEELL